MEPVILCYTQLDLCHTTVLRHKRQQYFATIIRVNDGAVSSLNRWFTLSIVCVTVYRYCSLFWLRFRSLLLCNRELQVSIPDMEVGIYDRLIVGFLVLPR